MDDRHAHRCQRSDDAEADARVLMNFIALAPYALNRDGGDRQIPYPPHRRKALHRLMRAYDLTRRIPKQRQRPPAGRPTELWPVPRRQEQGHA